MYVEFVVGVVHTYAVYWFVHVVVSSSSSSHTHTHTHHTPPPPHTQPSLHITEQQVAEMLSLHTTFCTRYTTILDVRKQLVLTMQSAISADISGFETRSVARDCYRLNRLAHLLGRNFKDELSAGVCGCVLCGCVVYCVGVWVSVLCVVGGDGVGCLEWVVGGYARWMVGVQAAHENDVHHTIYITTLYNTPSHPHTPSLVRTLSLTHPALTPSHTLSHPPTSIGMDYVATIFKNVLTPMQMARLYAASYPLFPDTLPLTKALMDEHGHTAAVLVKDAPLPLGEVMRGSLDEDGCGGLLPRGSGSGGHTSGGA